MFALLTRVLSQGVTACITVFCPRHQLTGGRVHVGFRQQPSDLASINMASAIRGALTTLLLAGVALTPDARHLGGATTDVVRTSKHTRPVPVQFKLLIVILQIVRYPPEGNNLWSQVCAASISPYQLCIWLCAMSGAHCHRACFV